MTDLIARLREEAFVRREYYPETAALLEEAAREVERLEAGHRIAVGMHDTAEQSLMHVQKERDSLRAQVNELWDENDALRAHPALTSWDSPDALRTRITQLQQPPYSPTDSRDSPEEPVT